MDWEALESISVESLVLALGNEKFLSNLHAAAERKKTEFDQLFRFHAQQRRRWGDKEKALFHDKKYWETFSMFAACNQISTSTEYLKRGIKS